MLTRKHSIQGRKAFSNTADMFGALDEDAAIKLAMIAGDITLVLDDSGVVLDCSVDPSDFPGFDKWVGTNWIDTVTTESRPKVMEMLAAARRGEVQHWRQVNHMSRDGDVPIRYVVVAVSDSDHRIAIGRDLREAAKVQQRLLQVQQSLERDYLKLRQTEARYRMLFDQTGEAMLVVDAVGHKIREANSAVHALTGTRDGGLSGKKLLNIFEKGSREDVLGLIGAALAAESVSPAEVVLSKGARDVRLSATGFTRDRKQYLLLRLQPSEEEGGVTESPVNELVEHMPDAFVVADAGMSIVTANEAFVGLVQAASLDQLRGRSLSDFVGRPGIDLELIEGQIDQHGSARNVSTVLRSANEEESEQIELSAVVSSGDSALYGFVIRPIGRRLRDLPPGAQDMPRSVEQLTDLVGRMSLKDIVRESTDLIERLCIEAALSYTSDNRASAAEILGLSRQSLYSKLHRYGLGNLPGESE